LGEDVLAGASCTLESENKHMKKSFSVVLILLVVINLSVAEETAFNGVRLADAKWKQDDARLTFSDNNKNMREAEQLAYCQGGCNFGALYLLIPSKRVGPDICGAEPRRLKAELRMPASTAPLKRCPNTNNDESFRRSSSLLQPHLLQ